MVFPFAGQGFIMKPLDEAQARWARYSGNVFPFFVTFQNLNRDGARKLLVNATVFFNFPHAALCIYHIWYVKGSDFGVRHNDAAEKVYSCSYRAVNQNKIKVEPDGDILGEENGALQTHRH